VAEGKNGVHQFRKHIDIVHPVGMVGEAAADFEVRQVEQSDDKYSAGIHEAKNIPRR